MKNDGVTKIPVALYYQDDIVDDAFAPSKSNYGNLAEELCKRGLAKRTSRENNNHLEQDIV